MNESAEYNIHFLTNFVWRKPLIFELSEIQQRISERKILKTPKMFSVPQDNL